MPIPLSRTDPAGPIALLHLPSNFDRRLTSLTDCGWLALDIVLGVLCGTTMGLLAAMAGNSY